MWVNHPDRLDSTEVDPTVYTRGTPKSSRSSDRIWTGAPPKFLKDVSYLNRSRVLWIQMLTVLPWRWRKVTSLVQCSSLVYIAHLFVSDGKLSSMTFTVTFPRTHFPSLLLSIQVKKVVRRCERFNNEGNNKKRKNFKNNDIIVVSFYSIKTLCLE